ncbi:MAG: ATP-binding protein [Bacteroidota bacterium]
MRWYVHLSVCLVMLVAQLGAQTVITPEKLTIEDGLSQGYISAIHQDREGFLWFGTKNGLNRYDGREFVEFTHDPDDPYTIANDWVTGIVEEGDFLLIATKSTDLSLLHKETKRFYRIPLASPGNHPIVSLGSIYRDELGQFWLNAIERQLLRLRFPANFWRDFPADTLLLEQVQTDALPAGSSYLATTDDPQFLVGRNAQNENIRLNVRTLETTALPDASPYRQFSYFSKIGPNLGLSGDLLGGNRFNLCVKKESGWEVIVPEFVFSPFFAYDKSQDLLWLQRIGDNKLLGFEVASLLNKPSVAAGTVSYVVEAIDYEIKSLCIDRSGVVWVGTAGLGIRKVGPRKLKVKNYLAGQSIQNSFYSVPGGELLPPFSTVIPGRKRSEISEAVNQIFRNTNALNHAWSRTDSGSWLALLDVTGAGAGNIEFKHFPKDDHPERRTVAFKGIYLGGESRLCLGRDQKLYLAHKNNFFQYDPRTGESALHTFALRPIQSFTVYDLAQTQNGQFWVATSNGLVRGQATTDGFDFTLVEGLRNNNCASLLVDPKNENVLWIGTKGGGLHRLDASTQEITVVNTSNGLPNNVIYGVLNDAAGNLWLSSNKGIINYHPATGDVRNFTVADGMQSNEFNTLAYGKGPDGTLYFGGINGLSVFHPDDLQDNPHRPAVRLTQLAINNEVVSIKDSTEVLKQAIEFTEQITLDYHQNSIALRFAALEYTTPSKNTYSYYLEGAEAPWSHVSTDNRAVYLNLAPGDYTFKVKAANGDMVWGDQVTTLGISIVPPWYRSTWAYLGYALLLGWVFWWSRRARIRRLRLKYDLRAEQQEAERLKEIDAFRSRFYTNITHEFRTPLTVILGTSERLKAGKSTLEQLQRQLSLISRNGKNLLNLVNQMLDLSKIEHDRLQIDYEQGDLLRYLRYITESYFSLANAANVLLKIESPQQEIWVDYDAEKIRQIVTNLLSNAIKYTPTGGKVLLTVKEEDDQLNISVRDTGKGIAKADLPHIFDRYFQVEEASATAGGTGIGLALTRELVKLLGGTIQVDSTLGQGSLFTVILPARREAPLQEVVPLVEPLTVATGPEDWADQRGIKDELPTLLIIEDNLDVVEYLNQCLREQYTLSFAYNGQAGIERALDLTPDLIISDVMMPEKTGFEVTATLKQDERTSHIPILLLTARADLDSRLSGLKQGADVYLPKPFHHEELMVNLSNLLATRQQLQKKYQQLALTTAPAVAPAAEDQEQAFLFKLREILMAELDNADLKAADVAKSIGMSRSNLYAKLSAVTGLSFNVYLRTLRLQRAKQLLQTTSRSVSEIAYAVGFNGISYFSDQFTKQFGVPPSKMRG